MTQAIRKLTFEEYASLDAEDWAKMGLPEGPCEYWDGELVELPTESELSELNDWIALLLRDILVRHLSPRLVRIGRCEIEVPGRPRTRYPDLVILRDEHISLTRRRLLITRGMAPPQLVAEVISPGSANRKRDYEAKRKQYQEQGIPEYWLIDPEHQSFTVLLLEDGKYKEVGCFKGGDRLLSPTIPSLSLTPEQLFADS